VLNHKHCDLALLPARFTQRPPAVMSGHNQNPEVLIRFAAPEHPHLRSTLTASRCSSKLHSLQLESGKCADPKRYPVALQRVCICGCRHQASLAKPHVGSFKCRTLEALAGDTWLAYNHTSHTFNNDNENDNTQFHPTAQRYHERSNVVTKLSYLCLESWPVHSVLQSQAEYPQ
jgi:hypothetical protein